MSKLHASINFSSRKKKQKNKVEFFDLNAKLVNDSAENLQQNHIDNDKIIRDENIITSKCWENELAEWESMLIDKEVSQLEEEEALRDNLRSLEGDLLIEYTYSAIDTKAKWELKSLFSFAIKISKYLNLNKSI